MQDRFNKYKLFLDWKKKEEILAGDHKRITYFSLIQNVKVGTIFVTLSGQSLKCMNFFIKCPETIQFLQENGFNVNFARLTLFKKDLSRFNELMGLLNTNVISEIKDELYLYFDRKIPKLSNLSFEALLRNRVGGITPNYAEEYEVLIQYKLKAEIALLLKHIVDGNQEAAQELLQEDPRLAILALGTVTIHSGHIIKKVTAIQLAYILEDINMCKILLHYCHNIPNGSERIHQQLISKILEIQKQVSQFKSYDYTRLFQTISEDEILKKTGKASNITKQEVAKFKDYFKPRIIWKGRPFLMQHLIDLLREYNLPSRNWQERQQRFFCLRIIAHLQKLVSVSYAQAFSQGLKKLVIKQQPLKRSLNIDCDLKMVNEAFLSKLFYFSSCDPNSQYILGRDFVIDINSGKACAVNFTTIGNRFTSFLLEEYYRGITLSLQDFSRQLRRVRDQCYLSCNK